MLLVQPAIPLSADALPSPLPSPLPELAGVAASATSAGSAGSAGSAAGLLGSIGADALPGGLWPLGMVPGAGDPAGAAPWLPWAPGAEATVPSMVSGNVGVPPADAAASEPLGATPDLGGIALLLGGLLVLAGWRRARR